MQKKTFLRAFYIFLFILLNSNIINAQVIIFSEGFEAGIPPNWAVTNGVWELCYPELGDPGPQQTPGSSYFTAATVCKGLYPGDTDSSLVSPSIELPTLVGKEEIQLRFWQWFSYAGGVACDLGYVQISVRDPATGNWSGWTTIGNSIADSSDWSRKGVDLTAYAGKTVRVAFYHTVRSDYPGGYNCSASSTGWYIDDVEMVVGPPELTFDFECDWDGWGADRGVWQVGVPKSGPKSAYSGSGCAGTNLSGNYPGDTDSRLISPTIDLPVPTNFEQLSFNVWQWFSYAGGVACDLGYVQISVRDPATGNWSSWTTIGNSITDSSAWSRMSVDLTAYAGKTVRVAFYHTARSDYPGGYNCSASSTGWYIDHIRLCRDSDCKLLPHFCECDLNKDGKCNILDYQKFIQDWGHSDCGTPPGSGTPPNDCECDLNKDGKCNILDYQRFIDDWGNIQCQTCP